MSDTPPIRLTQYSHGAGCGCKISPKVLESILGHGGGQSHPRLLVGYQSKDDAAVFDMGDGRAVISTTDFFMPIVDDPFDFGRIASVNAISDVYAMGGTPLMAIAVLGWPLAKIPAAVAAQVLDGSRAACAQAGIPLAGGHSIDAPEPIFGLAVTGEVPIANLKRNDCATAGCQLFLTKPLGVGLITTAQKRGRATDADVQRAVASMCTLNDAGAAFGKVTGVRALTDVTGFGFLGHLVEMCEGSGLSAVIDSARVPRLPGIETYLDCTPGGTDRNFESYGHKISALTPEQMALLCDPQTSGGLLVAVDEAGIAEFQRVAQSCGLSLQTFGRLIPAQTPCVTVQ
ncbi:MAG: selenide, water dikinase SelD [Pedosphaera sp.]|nr:selenide, water dikinase SelD [Pedosphaera sp.]